MRTGRIVGALVALTLTSSIPTRVVAQDPPAVTQAADTTPARVSYIHGQVSFWRPGGEEWAEAKINTPLAPGDVLYTGADGTVEVQFGPRAFVRAGNGTQLGLDNQEPDFVQFRVIAGHAALDLRELPAGNTVEIDTPNAAFTVERAGYYHVDLSDAAATFRTHRGGTATMTPAGGTATPIAANQQIVVTGTESPRVETGSAPQLTTWDKWNYQRTAYLLQPAATQHVPASVYGAEALAQHGTWRSDETYGPLWVPAAVAPGWSPYSTGRWIWDPRFGWTWLDDAPWGWAPYHYGRWVFAGNYWAWAPGPVVVRPVYSPALVVFLGGPVAVTVGVRPLHWAPLGWGEPLIPWWGRPGFVGVATWGGWGGPRVVNNVVVHRTTTVNVTNITVYKNVHVHNAVVAVPADRFGHGGVRPVRVENERVRDLTPVRGALEVRPVAASVMPAGGATVKPPAAISERKVVATRAPRDFSPALREQGLGAGREPTAPAAPQIVPAPTPRREKPPTPAATAVTPGAGPAEKGGRDDTPAARRPVTGPGRAPDAAPAAPGGARPPQPGSEDKPRGPGGPGAPDDKKARAAVPPETKPGNRAPRDGEPAPRAVVQPPPPPAHDPNLTRQMPKAPGAPDGPRARPDARPDARGKGPAEPRGRAEQGPPQGRESGPDRGDAKPGR
jgi:hypothetical protein